MKLEEPCRKYLFRNFIIQNKVSLATHINNWLRFEPKYILQIINYKKIPKGISVFGKQIVLGTRLLVYRV